MKVLIVEDEAYVARPMAEILEKNNYEVEVALDGELGLYEGLRGIYDLILLDIMLPKLDGFQVLSRLRKAGITTPVMMLTARTRVEDKIAGLDGGADDYLPKPIVYEELLARMRALLRRGSALLPNDVMIAGDLELNLHELLMKANGISLSLPIKEAQILAFLIRRGALTTPKELLIEKFWDLDSEIDGSHVAYHISMLRKKLKMIKSGVAIKNIRGVGYLLKVGP